MFTLPEPVLPVVALVVLLVCQCGVAASALASARRGTPGGACLWVSLAPVVVAGYVAVAAGDLRTLVVALVTAVIWVPAVARVRTGAGEAA